MQTARGLQPTDVARVKTVRTCTIAGTGGTVRESTNTVFVTSSARPGASAATIRGATISRAYFLLPNRTPRVTCSATGGRVNQIAPEKSAGVMGAVVAVAIARIILTAKTESVSTRNWKPAMAVKPQATIRAKASPITVAVIQMGGFFTALVGNSTALTVQE